MIGITMCRWAAYTGDAIQLSDVITNPVNSLIDQSLDAKMLDMPVKTRAAFSPKRRVGTSGEGYGFAWRGVGGKLGSFRDPTPAWDSDNIVNLSEHIVSSCFLAHMRAAPGRTVSEQNCHPFVHDGWMFQHNGFIGDFARLRRRLMLMIDPELFPYVEGNTDSEVCFYLALTFGLADDPVGALQKLRNTIEEARAEADSDLPFVATIAASDGEKIVVMRTSSDDAARLGNGFSSPSLYCVCGPAMIPGHENQVIRLPKNAKLIVSEPLALNPPADEWTPFPDQTIGVFEPGAEPSFTPIQGEDLLNPL